MDLLMGELESMDVDDENWGAKAIVMQENIEHHIEEEEGDMFRAARQVFDRYELEDLGRRMELRKQSARGSSASLSPPEACRIDRLSRTSRPAPRSRSRAPAPARSPRSRPRRAHARAIPSGMSLSNEDLPGRAARRENLCLTTLGMSTERETSAYPPADGQ